MAAPKTEPDAMQRRLDLLRQAAVFRDIPAEGLRSLAGAGRVRRYAAGEVLMRLGDPAPTLHVVGRGRVRVVHADPARPGGPVELAVLGPGEVVGEMGVLDGAPRSATVTAVEPTTTIELPAEVIAVAILQYPTVTAALLRTVSQRLRSTNDLIGRLVEMNGDWSGPW